MKKDDSVLRFGPSKDVALIRKALDDTNPDPVHRAIFKLTAFITVNGKHQSDRFWGETPDIELFNAGCELVNRNLTDRKIKELADKVAVKQ